MATEEDLRGFTIERLRELCAEKHISVTAKKKEELIARVSSRNILRGCKIRVLKIMWDGVTTRERQHAI